MYRRLLALLITTATCFTTFNAQAIDWPQEVVAEGGRIIVYQPQPEGLEGNRLKGRAAMSIVPNGDVEQIFGTFWFEARLETDRNPRAHVELTHQFDIICPRANARVRFGSEHRQVDPEWSGIAPEEEEDIEANDTGEHSDNTTT